MSRHIKTNKTSEYIRFYKNKKSNRITEYFIRIYNEITFCIHKYEVFTPIPDKSYAKSISVLYANVGSHITDLLHIQNLCSEYTSKHFCTELKCREDFNFYKYLRNLDGVIELAEESNYKILHVIIQITILTTLTNALQKDTTRI